MTGEVFEVVPVAHVIGGRHELTDDHWGSETIIRIDDSRFTEESVRGLDAFSHLEIVYRFHRADPADLHFGARRPRGNPDWPEVGIFGQRNKARVNWLGVSRARLLGIEGLDLHVADLDAVDGTPVLDIKPWFAEFAPRGETTQPAWPADLLKDYFRHPAR